METTAEVVKGNPDKDYFPSIFMNKDGTIIVLATTNTGDKTFAGTIIHSEGKTAKTVIGTYSEGWTYTQFKRLPRGSIIQIQLIQTDNEA